MKTSLLNQINKQFLVYKKNFSNVEISYSKSLRNENRGNMKLAAGLFSFAIANPATEDWAFRVWTEKADEVFEYANVNANDFLSAVNSQPDR